MEYPISLYRVCGYRLVRPGYDCHCVASLAFVGKWGELAVMADSTDFRWLPLA